MDLPRLLPTPTVPKIIPMGLDVLMFTVLLFIPTGSSILDTYAFPGEKRFHCEKPFDLF